jgi:hypothetical protein
MILKLLDGNGFKESYNFVYVPHDFKHLPLLVNTGYFFVNFTTHDIAVQAWDKLHGFKAWRREAQKVLRASWAAKTQGLEACIHRYKDSPVLRQDMPFECKPMRFENGQAVQFNHGLKLLPSPTVDGHYHGQAINFSRNALGSDGDDEDGIASVPVQTNRSSSWRFQSVGTWPRDTDLKIVVKNTFIDFAPVVEDLPHHGAQTCMARFSVNIPSFFAELAPKDAECVKAMVPTACIPPSDGVSSDRSTSVDSIEALTSLASGELEGILAVSDGPETTITEERRRLSKVLASVGAKLHGLLGEDGHPLCQPCGWFFKSSGCKNGVNCNYCHLCPQGTFKDRKRAKPVLLRRERVPDQSGEKTADARPAA